MFLGSRNASRVENHFCDCSSSTFNFTGVCLRAFFGIQKQLRIFAAPRCWVLEVYASEQSDGEFSIWKRPSSLINLFMLESFSTDSHTSGHDERD